jgi:myo-inositol 2-dehydrogenase/D-chiro-inositol 1-dehydrogenase
MITSRSTDRRDFLKSSSAITLGTLAGGAIVPAVHAAGEENIKVGLIGCGGRGSGAAKQALQADSGAKLWSMGDAFEDRLTVSLGSLSKDEKIAPKIDVPRDRQFVGFDAYKQVIDCCDVVLLCTPPQFRPLHLAAAVSAGKHVFAEKPVAVDVATAIEAIRAADIFQQKGKGFVAGTQRRHDPRYVETIKRIRDGAIGDVLNAHVYWNQGGLWSHQRKPEWSDMEFQLRNWLYYTWASGDHIVEQHVHNIDVGNWVFGAYPVRATAMGGRQTRTDAVYGHIFDHFAVEYEYADGRRMTSWCRQQDGTASKVAEWFHGTRGRSNAYDTIEGANAWKHPTLQGMNPYVEEHRNLVASIRAGSPLNEGRQIAMSNLSAILGREAAYTGQSITMDELMASNLSILPSKWEFGTLATPAVPTPGETTLQRTFSEGW